MDLDPHPAVIPSPLGRTTRSGAGCVRGGFASAWLAGSVALVGCAGPGPSMPSGGVASPAELGALWEPMALPGKRSTRYQAERQDGQWVWRAEADRSASMWRHRVRLPADQVGQLRFRWRVDGLIPRAVVADVDLDDAPARVVVAFDGDHSRLSLRNRMLFELAGSLSGEPPPYATLMYVWSDGSHAPGTVLTSPRTDRVRKIVLDAGAQHLRQWRLHERDLAADYQMAFGERPGDILGVALMTDADNTGGRAMAWYGDVALSPRVAMTR